MSDNVREAAERLRENKYDVGTEQREEYSGTQLEADCETLAMAYLAEHPSEQARDEPREQLKIQRRRVDELAALLLKARELVEKLIQQVKVTEDMVASAFSQDNAKIAELKKVIVDWRNYGNVKTKRIAELEQRLAAANAEQSFAKEAVKVMQQRAEQAEAALAACLCSEQPLPDVIGNGH